MGFFSEQMILIILYFAITEIVVQIIVEGRDLIFYFPMLQYGSCLDYMMLCAVK